MKIRNGMILTGVLVCLCFVGKRAGAEELEKEQITELEQAVPETEREEPVTEEPPETEKEEPLTEAPPETEREEPLTEALPETESKEPATEAPPETEREEPVTEEPPETEKEEPLTEAPPETEREEPLTEALPETESKEPATEAPEPSTQDSGDRETKPSVYLGIDNSHVYGGMERSFSAGYTPVVEKEAFTIVIPFTASGKLKDKKLTVDLDFGDSKDAPFQFLNYQKDVSRKAYIFQTKKGEEKQKAYLYRCKVFLQKDAAPGQYPVTVKAFAYTEENRKITLDTKIYVQVPEPLGDVVVIDPGKDNQEGTLGSDGTIYGQGETEELIRQPKMLLDTWNLGETELQAGDRREMKLVFKNQSVSQSMYNLKVTLSSESREVSFSKNSYYFSSVAPGGTIDLENQLEISRNITESVVPVTFTFEYEDKKGTAASGTEKAELRILQPISVELETSGIPVSLYASDTVEIPVKVLNLSRTGVYNVRVRLEGSGLFPTEEVFIGNMEAGTAEEGTMRIYVGTRTMKAIGEETGTTDEEKYGPAAGVMTLTCEDFLGNPYEIKKDYQTEIKKAKILSLKVEEEEAEKNSWWFSIFAMLLASMGVMILLLGFRLKRNNLLLAEARKEAEHET